MMKNFLLHMVAVAFVLAIFSCGKTSKSSMDETTQQELIEAYGEPLEVSLSEPGTLSEALDGQKLGDVVFLRVFGPMDGDDIAFLNESDLQHSLKVLDLLDAHLVAGGKAYYIDVSDEKIKMEEDNVVAGYCRHRHPHAHASGRQSED